MKCRFSRWCRAECLYTALRSRPCRFGQWRLSCIWINDRLFLAHGKRDSPARHVKTRMRFVELEDFHQEVVFRHGSFLLQDEVVFNMAWRTVSLYCFPMSLKNIKLESIKPLLPVTLLIVFGKCHELKKRSETILVILILHVFSFHGIEVGPELPTNVLHPRMFVSELVFVRRMKPSKWMPDGDHCEVVVFAFNSKKYFWKFLK